MWFFRFIFSSLPQHSFVEVRISRSVSGSPLEFDITRVDLSDINMCYYSSSENASECMLAFSHLHDTPWHHIKRSLNKYIFVFVFFFFFSMGSQSHLIMVSQKGIAIPADT